MICDVETTSFPKKGPLVQDGQARICQIAAILCDEDGRHMAEFCALIQPDGWTVSLGAQEVHGFSDELLRRYGLPSYQAVTIVSDMMQLCDAVICHNVKFDWNMLSIEYAYAGMTLGTARTFCTMEATTNLCKLPGQYGYKWPKLKEALPIICGRELGDDAHDAMVDAKGCKDIFFELKRRGLV